MSFVGGKRMISFVLADSYKDEAISIKNKIHLFAASLSDEHWDYSILSDIREYLDFIKTKPLIHFCCFDIKLDDNNGCLTELRKDYDQMQLMLIADKTMSPYKYLKPGIRPDSVLLRPFGIDDFKEVMEEYISLGIKRLIGDQIQNAFLISNKDESILLEYNNIFYFEAREKKIFVRTLKEEYCFYDTLDELQESLPNYFLRCHRSFIVNANLINKLLTSSNMIELKQGFSIPVSRSYKPIIKDRINERE